jgi:hypothetical protein
MNWVSEYSAINLKSVNVVTKAARPSRMMSKMQRMSCTLDVNGLAALDSLLLNDMPVCAAFNAPQSLAPSPHIATGIHTISERIIQRTRACNTHGNNTYRQRIRDPAFLVRVVAFVPDSFARKYSLGYRCTEWVRENVVLKTPNLYRLTRMCNFSATS